MSKTSPVRWWRDDATRYHARRTMNVLEWTARKIHAAELIMSDYLIDVSIRAAGGWRGFAVVEPRDSLLDREHPPDPWEAFALRVAEGTP